MSEKRNIESQFVDYDTAKMLKELKFEEDCHSYYLTKKNALYGKAGTVLFHAISGGACDWNWNEVKCSRPLWHQAEEWLWKKHNLRIATVYEWGKFASTVYGKQKKNSPDNFITATGNFNSPITAKTEGIKQAVKHIHSKK